MKALSRILALAAAAAIAMPATVLAQEGVEEEIEEVTVTGTRSKPRSAADSPVPIDSFGEDQLAPIRSLAWQWPQPLQAPGFWIVFSWSSPFRFEDVM